MMKVLAVWLLTCASCATVSPSPTPKPTQTCATVCELGASRGCEYSLPTLMGAPCVEVCMNADRHGHPWKLECLAKITTCGDDGECP